MVTFDFSVIAILFDSEHYDKNLTEEEVQWYYDFFDSMKLNETNPTVDLPYG